MNSVIIALLSLQNRTEFTLNRSCINIAVHYAADVVSKSNATFFFSTIDETHWRWKMDWNEGGGVKARRVGGQARREGREDVKAVCTGMCAGTHIQRYSSDGGRCSELFGLLLPLLPLPLIFFFCACTCVCASLHSLSVHVLVNQHLSTAYPLPSTCVCRTVPKGVSY